LPPHSRPRGVEGVSPAKHPKHQETQHPTKPLPKRSGSSRWSSSSQGSETEGNTPMYFSQQTIGFLGVIPEVKHLSSGTTGVRGKVILPGTPLFSDNPTFSFRFARNSGHLSGLRAGLYEFQRKNRPVSRGENGFVPVEKETTVGLVKCFFDAGSRI
jgi:hypothetical protein